MEIRTFFQHAVLSENNLNSGVPLLHSADCVSNFQEEMADISADIFVNKPGYSDASFFFDKNKKNVVVNTWYQAEIVNFSLLIEERKKYLAALTKLERNWISGKSEIPNAFVVDMSCDVLNSFQQYFDKKRKENDVIDIPKLIMGPIPTGGICLEFHIDHENALYISLHNNENIDLDIKYFNYYSTIVPNKRKVTAGILENYGLLTQSRNS